TLLVIDLSVSNEQIVHWTGTMLGDLFPQVLSFVISFLVVGLYWIAHHRIFGYIKRYDPPLIWINLVFLMFIAFLPFPSLLVGSHLGEVSVPKAAQISVAVLYSAVLALIGILQLLLWVYATTGHRLVAKALDPLVIRTG